MVMQSATTWDYYAPPVGEVTEWDTGETEWDAVNNAAADIRYDIVVTRDRYNAFLKQPGPIPWPIRIFNN